jgi:hypothetical protein
MSMGDANNSSPTHQGDSSSDTSNMPSQLDVMGGHPPLDLGQIDPASLPPELLLALQQLDPERQRRALEMLLTEQLEQQAAVHAEEQLQQQLPDEHFLTIALNGEFNHIRKLIGTTKFN